MTCATLSPIVRATFKDYPFAGCNCPSCVNIRKRDELEAHAKAFVATTPRHIRRQVGRRR